MVIANWLYCRHFHGIQEIVMIMDVNEQNGVQDFRPFPTWKRVLDLCVIIASIPISVPVCALISLYIKIASPGPVIFRQERIGLNGRRFMCLKFRTMHVGADNSDHRSYLGQLINSQSPMIKLDAKGDSRIIPGCSILRAIGLDELPQLLNVLRGDMSVVGPRPCIPYEYDHFSISQQRRCNVRPGLTGLWQVSGKNRTTFQQMIDLDIRYAATYSLRLDLFIMLKTPFVLMDQLVGKLLPAKELPVGVVDAKLPDFDRSFEKATR